MATQDLGAITAYAEAVAGGFTGTKEEYEAALANAAQLSVHVINTNNPHSVTKSQIGLSEVDNTKDANKPISSATQAALNNKVDKITGKGLSTNDYTAVEKTKLAGIETGAQVNVVPTWNSITGKPTTFAPSEHSHTQSSITGLTDALATKLTKANGTMTLPVSGWTLNSTSGYYTVRVYSSTWEAINPDGTAYIGIKKSLTDAEADDTMQEAWNIIAGVKLESANSAQGRTNCSFLFYAPEPPEVAISLNWEVIA